MSADGEQTAADAERSLKAAQDQELFVRNTLLTAEGNNNFIFNISSLHKSTNILNEVDLS